MTGTETRATAGTPGDGYRTADRAVHVFDPRALEPGCRPLCAVCGDEQASHVPTPRSAEGGDRR